MKKLALLLPFVACSAFAFPTESMIVNNDANAASIAKVYGQLSLPVDAKSSVSIPWVRVFSLCGNHNPCIAEIDIITHNGTLHKVGDIGAYLGGNNLALFVQDVTDPHYKIKASNNAATLKKA